MALLRAIEIFLVCLFLYGVVTQFALPLIRGTAILPFLREQRRLESKIVEKRQQEFERELENMLGETEEDSEKEKEEKGL